MRAVGRVAVLHRQAAAPQKDVVIGTHLDEAPDQRPVHHRARTQHRVEAERCRGRSARREARAERAQLFVREPLLAAHHGLGDGVRLVAVSGRAPGGRLERHRQARSREGLLRQRKVLQAARAILVVDVLAQVRGKEAVHEAAVVHAQAVTIQMHALPQRDLEVAVCAGTAQTRVHIEGVLRHFPLAAR